MKCVYHVTRICHNVSMLHSKLYIDMAKMWTVQKRPKMSIYYWRKRKIFKLSDTQVEQYVLYLFIQQEKKFLIGCDTTWEDPCICNPHTHGTINENYLENTLEVIIPHTVILHSDYYLTLMNSTAVTVFCVPSSLLFGK